jgi:hypothetical protein
MKVRTIAQWATAALLAALGATYANVARASGAGLCTTYYWCETPCSGCGIPTKYIPWGTSGSMSTKTGISFTEHNGNSFIYVEAKSGCGDVQTTDGNNEWYQDGNYGSSYGGQVFTAPTANIMLRDCW